MTPPQLSLFELEDTGEARLESYSPACIKVHRALSLAGFSCERRTASAGDIVRRRDPFGRLPLLLVDGRPTYDSTEIVSLLDVLSGAALSQGLDRRARAEAFLWQEMAGTVLNNFLIAARWLDEDNWPRTRDAYFASMALPLRVLVPGHLRSRVRERLLTSDIVHRDPEACWSRFVTTLDELEARAPESGFWLGDSPSRADIAIFAQLVSFRTKLTPNQSELVTARRRLSAWLERIDAACAACERGTAKPRMMALPPPTFRLATSAFA